MLLAAFVLFVALILFGVPIAYAIGIAAAGYMWLADIPMVILAQQIANGPDSWVLLAMPLFVLAGLLMNDTGIAGRLIDFAHAMVGHLRGGLGMVDVTTSMLFGGLSGSSVADAAGTGSVIIPGMIRAGYKPEVAAAITSSSASIGIIIPPSIPMILYGAITTTSVGTLFVAGVVPGIVVGLAMMIAVAWLARRNRWGRAEPFSFARLASTGYRALWALLMPVIILGGILGGVFTPTEAGAVAVVYGVVIAMFAYRTLTLRRLYRSLVNAGVLTAVVMLIVSTSYTFGWVMAHEQVPQGVAAWFSGLDLSREGSLVVVSLILFLLGCVLHGDALLLLVVPVVLPAVKALGVDPVHFGMVCVLCVALGQQTPPVGSTLFVASALTGRDIFAISRQNIPFIGCLLFTLALLIAIPDMALWLPRRLGMME